MTQQLIEGRKKGGSRSPQESPDTLSTTQIAEIVGVISEGEAQGLVNGLKSVYLDGVPIENDDGSRNFEGVEFAYVVGTQGQPALPGLNAVQNEVAVGVQVDQATPLIRTITDPDVDHVRVTIRVPTLTELNSENGDLNGAAFEWAVEVQANGAGFVERHRQTISAKSNSGFTEAVKIELTGVAPWDVRVRRVSADPGTANLQNRFTWASYTEITSVKLRYPNSAVYWLRANAKYFGRIPVVSFDWLGQRVKVPSNYNPITRAYTGVWNGTFVMAWTNNPAWLTFDLVTHERYGLGKYVPSALANKWRMYAIGRYSDELVDDGRGGQEPRFACNVNITTRVEALRLLRDMVSVFRGMLLWQGAEVDFVQDAPQDATLLYVPANTSDGLFNYEDASEKTKRSVFICWWSDLQQFGKRVPEAFVDEDLVARYGVEEIEVAGFGCTSRGQAARLARWARHTQESESDVVSFTVGSDGVAATLGRVFKIADPSEAGERLGGRIHSATAAQVTLDAPVTLAAGEAYTLTVLQPDPANMTGFLTEQRAVTNSAGVHTVLNLASALSAAPVAQTLWVLESTGIAATSWRCIGAEEVAGKNQFRITGVAHNPSKYAAIEQGLVLDQRPISRIRPVPTRPASLAFVETTYQAGQLLRSRVTVSWPEPERGLRYSLGWRLNGGGWTDVVELISNSFDLDGLAPGALEVRVRSVNALGNASAERGDTFAVGGAGQLNGMFRAVARGFSDTAAPIQAGLYDAVGTLISGVARSYAVNVFRRSDRVMVSQNFYDVYGSSAAATAMATLLNGLGSDMVVVVRTYDEPSGNRLLNGLDAAMYRCGASRAVFGSPQFFSRSAYVLVAIAGCGEGQGHEQYQGDAAATNAWCDVSFMITDAGHLVVSGTNSTPRTLADYSYTGDLGATRDLSLVVGSGTAVISGNSASKPSGAAAWDSDVRSTNSYSRGAYASAVLDRNDRNVMVGLNTDPATDGSYASIDYAVFGDTNGTLQVYESGAFLGFMGAFAPGDEVVVAYDGARVYYSKNGVIFRTVNAPQGLRLYFDSSFYSVGASISRIRFGPMPGVYGIDTPQLAAGSVTETFGAYDADGVFYGNAL